MQIDFRSRYLNIVINDFFFELWGHIVGHKHWEFEIWENSVDEKSFGIEVIQNIRVFAHRQFVSSVSFGNYNLAFMINDDREWDFHTDNYITWQEACKLPEKREGKPKFKFRNWRKQKWYFSSKYLNVYNLDFLNDPYGVTIEFLYLPFLCCVTLKLGKEQDCSSGLKILLTKTPKEVVCNFKVNFWGWFSMFKIQKKRYDVLTQIVDRDKNFQYYSMEDEKDDYEPHIHVCVDFNNPKWGGERFENFQPLKTVATVILLPKDSLYTCENINIDEVNDSKIYNYKQQICDWLNAPDSDLGKSTNSQHALRNYLLSNPNCCSLL